MLLHACLLLLLIATDKILSWSGHYCGGHVLLDRETSGPIKLSLPFSATSTLPNPISQRADEPLQPFKCTWVLDVPSEGTVLLKLEWSDGDSTISLRCEEDRILQRGDTALLSSCEGNKATLTWTGAGRSSDSAQLVYYVHENERNSSEVLSTQDPTGWSQTGTTVRNIATVAEEVVRGTEEGRGHLYEDSVRSSDPRFVSNTSTKGGGALPSTSRQRGISVAGGADRETLPLPEEIPNNGVDASGAAHLTGDPMSARTLPYFQHAVSMDGKSQTQNPTLIPTEMSWTNTKVPLIGADFHKSTQTSTHSDHRGSRSSALLTISPSETPALERTASLFPHGGAKHQYDLAVPWMRHEPTHRSNSDLISATTSDPVKPFTIPPQQDSSGANTDTQPTTPSSLSSHDPSRTHSPLITAVDLHTNQESSFTPDATPPTASSPDEKLERTDVLRTLAPSNQSQADSSETTERLMSVTPSSLVKTAKKSTHATFSTSDKDDGQTLASAGSLPTPRAAHREKIQMWAATGTLPITHDNTPSGLATSDSFPSSYTTQFSDRTRTSFPTEFSKHTTFVDHQTATAHSYTSQLSHAHHPSYTNTHKQSQDFITTGFNFKIDNIRQWFSSRTTEQIPTTGPTVHSSKPNQLDPTPSALIPSWHSTKSPVFYIVPNRPATIRVETVELLLQVVVEESRSASGPGLDEDTTTWVQPYLQKAPGFRRLLGVWSSGHAVQILVEFKTNEALPWLGASAPMSLLEQMGLTRALHEGRKFRSSRITNITLGGLQADVCDWLLQCPAGYKCMPELGTTNHSCSSLCRFDYCHHHGICTHHSGQLPVCRCLVGDDFWFMGQRCDLKMTRMRLVGACLAILLIIAFIMGAVAFVAVRRYRAILIQAKVNQTRSSYRRFNHFDELSGRFWLRSWAESADSLDNPGFTRSEELLHLRALDRPCCYHDDTLSLPSTCPSHAARINTIYPHSSQYGWRGSELSMGDGVLDSGKASDLSVCSWPVEPINWTPFPLLQQLASHRTPPVRVSRPRSYCEGMELVDLGKSWTA
uniref:EGF-like domain-containing protein n=4 Tax=Nothobranchius kuhntae TaxID=321403 RepID=A0A1A8J4I7_NOTKU